MSFLETIRPSRLAKKTVLEATENAQDIPMYARAHSPPDYTARALQAILAGAGQWAYYLQSADLFPGAWQ